MTEESKIKELIAEELDAMCAKYGADFASLPEAYAVTLEEVEEAGEEMELMTVGIKDLWDAVRYNYVLDQKQQIIRRINKHALKCVQECVQVAACCIKALRLRDV